jgi:hypothetical protein
MGQISTDQVPDQGLSILALPYLYPKRIKTKGERNAPTFRAMSVSHKTATVVMQMAVTEKITVELRR